MSKIPKGYYLKPRVILDSDIFDAPPQEREVWDLLICKANHSDQEYNGFSIKRGQTFTTYHEIQESLSWKSGYRTEKYSMPQIMKAVKSLKAKNRIETEQLSRGLLITICNYNHYQNPSNYTSMGNTAEILRRDSVTTYNKGTYDTERNRKSISQQHSINNNDIRMFKNEKKDIVQNSSKNAELLNILFVDFWNKYDYKVGKQDTSAYWSGYKPINSGRKITDEDRSQIMEYLDKYIYNTNKDGTFPSRKHPKNFLFDSCWLDEPPFTEEDQMSSMIKRIHEKRKKEKLLAQR